MLFQLYPCLLLNVVRKHLADLNISHDLPLFKKTRISLIVSRVRLALNMGAYNSLRR